MIHDIVQIDIGNTVFDVILNIIEKNVQEVQNVDLLTEILEMKIVEDLIAEIMMIKYVTMNIVTDIQINMSHHRQLIIDLCNRMTEIQFLINLGKNLS
jgi:hypothetical protein